MSRPAGTCSNCRAWQKSPTELGQGQCIACPPTMLATPRGLVGMFPVTGADNYCWNYAPENQADGQGKPQDEMQGQQQGPAAGSGRILHS